VPDQSRSEDEKFAIRQVRAWYFLVAMVALHVLDEAATGFLDFYNPLVLRVRAVWPRFPMPTFTFSVWLTGLTFLVLGLALVGPLVRRGAAGTRAAAWLLSAIMLLNGAGHLVGSLYFGRRLPGVTSAPFLILGGGLLASRTWQRAAAARRHIRENAI